jgi:cytochrome c biogenesis protein CcdA
MLVQFLLSLFIIGVGLSFAGVSTHLYQGVSKQVAYLRFDGESYLGSMGHLLMSFLCGPFILMQLGWKNQESGITSISNMLLGSLVGFGWGFLNGLLLLGVYFAVGG